MHTDEAIIPIPCGGMLVIDEREDVLVVAKNHAKVKMPRGYVYQTVGFPKGGFDERLDNSLRDTAIREMVEETGADIRRFIIPDSEELIRYANYKIDRKGDFDFAKPKEIHMFGAYSTQRKYVPPDRKKHPYAKPVSINKIRKIVENPFDREAMEKVAGNLLQMRRNILKELRKKRIKIFV